MKLKILNIRKIYTKKLKIGIQKTEKGSIKIAELWQKRRIGSHNKEELKVIAKKHRKS